MLTKELEDNKSLSIDHELNAAIVKLSQEETLAFNERQIVEIQMRILTTGGDALASNIVLQNVTKLLEDTIT